MTIILRLVAICLIALVAAPLEAQFILKQGIATVVPVGILVDELDGITPQDAPGVANIEFAWRQPFQATTIASILTNGAFADATGWTLGGTWAVGGGTLNAVNETGTIASANPACVQFVSYRVIYTVSSFTDGTVTVSLGGTAGTARGSAATFTEEIVCGSTGLIEFTGGTAATLSIDNVSINQEALRITAAASATANDMVLDEDGQYHLELTAAQTSIMGPHVLCAVLISTFVPFCQDFLVVAEASYDANVEGDLTTLAAIDAAIDTDTVLYATAADIPIYIYDTTTNLGKAGLSDITCSITGITAGVVGATATTTDTTEEEVDATLHMGEYTVRATIAENTFDKVMMDCVSATSSTSVYKTYWYPQR